MGLLFLTRSRNFITAPIPAPAISFGSFRLRLHQTDPCTGYKESQESQRIFVEERNIFYNNTVQDSEEQIFFITMRSGFKTLHILYRYVILLSQGYGLVRLPSFHWWLRVYFLLQGTAFEETAIATGMGTFNIHVICLIDGLTNVLVYFPYGTISTNCQKGPLGPLTEKTMLIEKKLHIYILM